MFSFKAQLSLKIENKIPRKMVGLQHLQPELHHCVDHITILGTSPVSDVIQNQK